MEKEVKEKVLHPLCQAVSKMSGLASRLMVLLLAISFNMSARAWSAAEPYTLSVEYLPVEIDSTPDSSFYSRYPYVILIDEGDDADVSDMDFYQYAASVIFKVGKSDLPANDQTLQELREKVFPQISRDSLKVVRVRMQGSASPEGPEPVNKRLAENRAKALYDFVGNYLQIPQGDSLQLVTEMEDYNSLYKRMMQDGDPDCERVKQLYDAYMPNQDYANLKRALQKIDGGRLWRRMLVSYFPSLRSARMIIVCQRKPVPEPPVEVVPPVEPQPVVPVVVQPTEPETWVERYPRRELLSIKTNLLMYGVYMPGYDKWCPIPNIAIEYYPLRGHFTYGASFDCPWWQNYWGHKYFQVRNYQVEARYYIRRGDIELRPEGQGAAFKGFYLQGYGHVALYGICFDERRGWVGEGIGGGLGLGYVLPISKKGHWKLEFSLQAGVFFTGYDPYQYENPVNPAYQDHLYYYDWKGKASLFQKRQYRFTWVGPTRIGVSLCYDLLYRKARNKTNGVRMPQGTKPTRKYNRLVPYEKGVRP